MEVSKIFETTDLDLGAYLMMEGLKYMGCKLEETQTPKKPLVSVLFLDEKCVARDLERSFMISSEKRYRDLTKYLLKEVHKRIRETQEK